VRLFGRRPRSWPYGCSMGELLDAGAIPDDAAAYQGMTGLQRLVWLRQHPYTAARVDLPGLDAATRRRQGIVPFRTEDGQ
jgi:hypothetical protein